MFGLVVDFTLRQRIATAEKQIAGLQEYIRSIQK